MIIEITTEYAIKVQKELNVNITKPMEKLYSPILEFVFLRTKSHLSMQVLKKVVEIDKKELTTKTWELNLSRNLVGIL
mgnify:CR=1 FL=1